ncbi:hypothetical protein BDV96DRAFT_605213 [Lophiotrema nucula]|uniref:Uncharacterized protein n=1 Tax=Lophiotrema nucula TaxID=690887 RepID=A0A6A5YNR1_9PLEO|nr:hypothetical protein BDV96DRAFT_605213 [Lophiotrema nucula]
MTFEMANKFSSSTTPPLSAISLWPANMQGLGPETQCERSPQCARSSPKDLAKRLKERLGDAIASLNQANINNVHPQVQLLPSVHHPHPQGTYQSRPPGSHISPIGFQEFHTPDPINAANVVVSGYRCFCTFRSDCRCCESALPPLRVPQVLARNNAHEVPLGFAPAWLPPNMGGTDRLDVAALNAQTNDYTPALDHYGDLYTYNADPDTFWSRTQHGNQDSVERARERQAQHRASRLDGQAQAHAHDWFPEWFLAPGTAYPNFAIWAPTPGSHSFLPPKGQFDQQPHLDSSRRPYITNEYGRGYLTQAGYDDFMQRCIDDAKLGFGHPDLVAWVKARSTISDRLGLPSRLEGDVNGIPPRPISSMATADLEKFSTESDLFRNVEPVQQHCSSRRSSYDTQPQPTPLSHTQAPL